MLAVVIFLLRLERGLLRAGMFMAGRLVTYAGWSILLFVFTDRVFDLSPGSLSDFIPLLKAVLGLLLIAMAVKIALGGDDPDALPSKMCQPASCGSRKIKRTTNKLLRSHPS